MYKKCEIYEKLDEESKEVKKKKATEIEIKNYYKKIIKNITNISFNSKFIKRLKFLIKKRLGIDLEDTKDNLSSSSISSISPIRRHANSSRSNKK